MTPPDAAASVAVELAQIRGAIDTGHARVDGKLELLLQRGEHTDQRLTKVEAAAEKTDTRVTAVERKIWFALGGGTALGTVGGFLAAYLMQ